MPVGWAWLVDVDPDLFVDFPSEELAEAREHLSVPVLTLARGSWDPLAAAGDGGPKPFGYLVLDGLVAVEVLLAGRRSTQLLGAGDLLVCTRPAEVLSGIRPRHSVPGRTRVAVLHERFIALSRRWPQLFMALLVRTERQLERGAVHQAISQLSRVDERLVAILWLLGEQWGRMTADGVVVPIMLTHELLGRLVGARRPTVTLALAALAAHGHVLRRPDGTWLLTPGSRELLGAAPPAGVGGGTGVLTAARQ